MANVRMATVMQLVLTRADETATTRAQSALS